METQNFSALLFAVIVLVLSYYFLPRHKAPEPNYPPGPIVDNVPNCDPWFQYRDWGKQYGPLVYIRNKNILITNDLQVANDLLEHRTRIYSDREASIMLELTGMGHFNLAFQRYSNKWRRARKVFQQNFREATISHFHPSQYKEVHLFLQRMIGIPSQIMQHTLALSQGVVYSGLYTLDIASVDYIARKASEVIEEFFDLATLNGAVPMVEKFPWLRYLPSWFPGCSFKRLADQCFQRLREIETIPFDLAVNNLKTGSKTSLLAELAVQHEGDSEQIEAIQAMGVTSSLAGSDTTASSISSFLLAMAVHTDVQAKGQQEIDRVIGGDRLPTFEDRRSLPYVESIYREIMRLQPAVPLGVQHVSTEDDFYRGYHIPKGCTVIPNIWAMNRDPDRYPDPDKFSPERFFDSPDGPFVHVRDIVAFGFGRRVCPGRYMADNTIWLTIASVLATLNLSNAKDEKGNEVDISKQYTHGFLRHPKPFHCSVVPRSPYATELVLAARQSE
ncbi:hypothetical protein GYMLUDRAFT_218798 [Collybiopsis luxurians FD-317 M1]|nr:hypothetical protein GYMLUDRAFT_218798 [Collybiopsis luxurians FD-317 M1]